jgi:hypothetical protein
MLQITWHPQGATSVASSTINIMNLRVMKCALIVQESTKWKNGVLVWLLVFQNCDLTGLLKWINSENKNLHTILWFAKFSTRENYYTILCNMQGEHLALTVMRHYNCAAVCCYANTKEPCLVHER